VPAELTPAEAVHRARGLAVPGRRRILGITGAPGSGKSTLAAELASSLSPRAIVVPMDGFHLANAELQRLGRLNRKGAADTFDVTGYAALLETLRHQSAAVARAPAFDRTREAVVPGAIAIPRDLPLVITEGNYLLLRQPPWSAIASLLDEVWYVEADEAARVERLIARHMHHGKTVEQARAWALGTDTRNAGLIATTRHFADVIVAVPAGPPSRPAAAG
jgi:pantothenate kinase